jgi:hypothetical protein
VPSIDPRTLFNKPPFNDANREPIENDAMAVVVAVAVVLMVKLLLPVKKWLK